jgi:hypothetical protein
LTLILAVPFVVWPLIRHWQPRVAAEPVGNREEARLSELEEIEVDLAAGRLSEDEAAVRRRELR